VFELLFKYSPWAWRAGEISFASSWPVWLLITLSVVGALLIAVINNGLDLLAVSSFWQGIVTGAILIFAVWLDRFRHSGG
jgi:predicted ABC-type sugar transport system permease subunit